jgi:two-component system sensor histidine kinase BarA
MTSTRINDIHSELETRGQALAQSLVVNAEFGLFSGNEEVLKNVADSALGDPDVLSVTVSNADRDVVWNSYDESFPIRRVNDKGDLLYFSQPIYRSGVPVSDFMSEFFDEPEVKVDAPIGWVSVVLSRDSSVQRQNDVILNGVVIIFVGLFISLIVALRMGHGVAMPLLDLMNMVSNIRQGKLNSRVKEDASAELLNLQKGINAMAISLDNVHAQLQTEVDGATSKLQLTVQELERRNSELEVARRQALRASKAKTDFLAKMSHEIRTPVNAILGFTGLLKKALPEDSDNAEYARTIDQAASQLLYIINDILDFAKLELGDVELESLDFDMRECLEDVVSMLGPSVHDKGLELSLLINSDVPLKVIGDPMRFSQVFTNLLNNAVKFTSTGGVTAHLSLLEADDDEVVFKMDVIDTGIGLSEIEKQGLFQAFSQADSTISRRFGGTGLGLSIARRFSEMMGGEIGVESMPGSGATFWFTARFKKQQAEYVESIPVEFAGMNVLLYEPYPIARRVVRNALLDWKMQVFNTADPGRVVDMLKKADDGEREIDLLVMGLSAEETQAGVILSYMGTIREYYHGPILLMVNMESYTLPEPLQEDVHLLCISKPARRQTLQRSIYQLAVGENNLSRVSEACSEMQSGNIDFSSMRVLVADDNEFNLMLVTTLLGQQDVQIFEAKDGEEAIALYQQHEVDVILMDIHMPGTDGVEASRRIRALNPDTHIPIVALTADVFADHEQRLLKAGLDDVLFKPITEEGLLRTLVKWVCPQRGGAVRAELPSVATNESASEVSVDQCLANVPDALLPRLLQELAEHLQGAKQALEQQDVQTLHEHAHKLNGLIGYFSLNHLVDEVKTLEFYVLEEEWEKIHPQLDKVELKVNEILASAG